MLSLEAEVAQTGGPRLACLFAPVLLSERRGEDEMAKKARRTTHRSKSGAKLYAVRDSKGRFKDIQTYKRAHGQDIKRKGKKEAKKKK
jgi:hypothetical protein